MLNEGRLKSKTFNIFRVKISSQEKYHDTQPSTVCAQLLCVLYQNVMLGHRLMSGSSGSVVG